MNTPHIGHLDTPGASIYHEVRGAGPVLLLIAGGNGDAGPFERIANELAAFTVVAYDRRGYSRSPLEQSPAKADPSLDDRGALERDVDDARRLLERYSDGPACVFGSSSGAIVALDLLSRHPGIIRRVVAHEPPVLKLLPDAAERLQFIDDVYATYRDAGVTAAMQKFMAGVGMSDRQPPPAAQLPPHVADMVARVHRNQEFWLEHELRQYARVMPDLVALKSVAAKLVLAGGRDSHAFLPYRADLALAERLGLRVMDFPGNHVGYMTQPTEFAEHLANVLRLA